MTFGIIVDWYGPYFDLASLKKSAKDYAKGEKVLYMGVSKGNIVNYVGLSTSASSRFDYHHKLSSNQDKFTKYFIGNIESQGVSGPRPGKQPRDLKLAEHMLINVLYPDFNTVSKDGKPQDCGSLYSRFFLENGEGDYDDGDGKPLPKFPTFIGYNSYAETYEYSSSITVAN